MAKVKICAAIEARFLCSGRNAKDANGGGQRPSYKAIVKNMFLRG
jgi:hypothetical protein